MSRETTQEERDSAKRMADAVNAHVHARRASESPAGYVAIRLRDGSDPDRVMYDTRADVFRHHPHDRYLFAVKIGMETMSEREAMIVLQMSRMAFRRGVIFADEEVVTPQLTELMQGFIPRTLGALKRPSGLHLPGGKN